MLKSYFPLFFLLVLSVPLSSQASLFEDFESYSDGDLITIISEDWKLWPKGADANVTQKQAASGTKSLMLEGGRKTDLYFPFNGRYTAGAIQFSMDILVAAESSAYFSLQGKEQPGIVWSMQCYFGNNGFLRMEDDGVTKIQSNYPQGEWFTMTIDINFDTHLWRYYIDDACIGSYVQENETRQSIASLALWPDADSSLYFVDNISFEHQGRAEPVSIVTDAAIDALYDNSVQHVKLSSNSFAGVDGEEFSLECLLKNEGQAHINSVQFETAQDGNLSSQKFSIDLPVGADTILILDEKMTYQGQRTASLSITNINGLPDDNSCNDKTIIESQGFKINPSKKVWVEEATGTWCPWCPRGDVYMRYLSEKYPDQFVGVAVHQGDPMEQPDWIGKGVPSALLKRTNPNAKKTEATGLSKYIRGFPSAVVNRSEVLDPLKLELAFLKSASEVPLAILSHKVKWDDEARLLEVKVTVDPQEIVSEDVWLVVGLSEDEVYGEGSKWAQQNMYSEGASGLMGGYELLPVRVPDTDMKYNHVAKLLLTEFGGDYLGQPFSKRKKSVTKSYSSSIPSSWSIENMHVVSGLIIGPNGVVYNAEKSSVVKRRK